jgi:glycerate dehydrogenase
MPRLVVLDGHTLSPSDLSFEELAKLGELAVFERTPPELLVERFHDG